MSLLPCGGPQWYDWGSLLAGEYPRYGRCRCCLRAAARPSTEHRPRKAPHRADLHPIAAHSEDTHSHPAAQGLPDRVEPCIRPASPQRPEYGSPSHTRVPALTKYPPHPRGSPGLSTASDAYPRLGIHRRPALGSLGSAPRRQTLSVHLPGALGKHHQPRRCCGPTWNGTSSVRGHGTNPYPDPATTVSLGRKSLSAGDQDGRDRRRNDRILPKRMFLPRLGESPQRRCPAYSRKSGCGVVPMPVWAAQAHSTRRPATLTLLVLPLLHRLGSASRPCVHPGSGRNPAHRCPYGTISRGRTTRPSERGR